MCQGDLEKKLARLREREGEGNQQSGGGAETVGTHPQHPDHHPPLVHICS